MQKYVLAIAETPGDQIVLVEKNRPKWQAGLYNFVGGKVEEGETALMAMQREFMEETGVLFSDWTEIGTMARDGGFHIDVFYACDPSFACATTFDEPIFVASYEAFAYEFSQGKCVSGLMWLYHMAKDPDKKKFHVSYE